MFQLMSENDRLKTQVKSQEDDREFLVRQLVSLKKDNTRLRKEMERSAASSLRWRKGGEVGREGWLLTLCACRAALNTPDPGVPVGGAVAVAVPITATEDVSRYKVRTRTSHKLSHHEAPHL